MPTIVRSVPNDAEDAYTYGGARREDRLYVMTNYGAAVTQISGWRFYNVTIPKDSTIVSAHMEGNVPNLAYQNIDFWLDCEDNSFPDVIEGGILLDNRTITGNQVHWQSVGTGWKVGPSFIAAVQAVINRSDWVSGNNLCCMGEDKQASVQGFFDEYQNNPAMVQQLHIEYEEPVIPGEAKRSAFSISIQI